MLPPVAIVLFRNGQARASLQGAARRASPLSASLIGCLPASVPILCDHLILRYCVPQPMWPLIYDRRDALLGCRDTAAR
jgi:hypothetical protein